MAKLKKTAADAKKLFDSKKGTKDEGLQKALKEFEKGSNDPAWLLELIEKVDTSLKKLEKNKDADISKFCKELRKSVDDETKSLKTEKAKVDKTVDKSKEGSDYDDNWTEEQAQLMLKAMRAVKKKPLPDDEAVRLEHGHGGRPFLLCIGGNRKGKAALLVAPKPSIKKLVGKYKKECMRATAKPGGTPGKKLITGMIYGGPKYVFCVDGKPPGGMTKLIKKATLWQLAGLIKIAGVIVSGGGVTLDDENDNEEFNEASIPDVDDKALDQETDEPEVDDKAAYETRWNGLQGDLKKVLTEGKGEVDRIKVLVQTVTTTAKNGDYESADELLDELEGLLKAALSGTAPPPEPTGDKPPTPPPPPPQDKKALVSKRRKEIEPKVLQALKENRGDTAKMKTLLNFVLEKEKAEAYDVALQGLDNLEKVLQQAPSAIENANPLSQTWKDKKREVEKLMKLALQKDSGLAGLCNEAMSKTTKFAAAEQFKEAIDEYTTLEGQLRKQAKLEPTIIDIQKSRLTWDSTRKLFQSELKRAESAIIDAVKKSNEEATDEESEVFDPSEIATKLKELYTHIDTNLDGVLIDILDEALNAEGDARKKHHDRAAKKVDEYKKFLESDQMQVVQAAKAAFVSDLKVHETVSAALSELAAKLV